MGLAGPELMMRVLTVNAGSSSLKLRLLGAQDEILRTLDLPAGTAGIDVDRLADALRDCERPDVVGHRVVHGGPRFAGPVLIDEEVRQQLSDLTDLAPLHQHRQRIREPTSAFPPLPWLANSSSSRARRPAAAAHPRCTAGTSTGSGRP
jgi:acetate kinase